jgi:hypothetical protein
MSNEKQQTAVEWFSQRAYELFEQYSEGKFDRITLNKLMLEATDKAKEIEKEQRISDFTMGITNANRMEATKYAEQWYNETYGGNK